MYWAIEFASEAEKHLYSALDQSTARYKNVSAALMRFNYISRMQCTNNLLRDSHPDQEGTKGPLTGKKSFAAPITIKGSFSQASAFS